MEHRRYTTVVHPSWTRTTLVTNRGEEDRKRMGKVMEADDVAKAIVGAILSCRGGQLLLPSSKWMASLRYLPCWLQELVRDGASALLRT